MSNLSPDFTLPINFSETLPVGAVLKGERPVAGKTSY